MQRSIYLARLIGPIFVVIGVGMLLNAPAFLAIARQFLASYALIYLAGLITLTAGIALVLAHNVWIGNWRLIITVLGWLGVIGGVFRIVLAAGSRRDRHQGHQPRRSAHVRRIRRARARRRAQLFRL